MGSEELKIQPMTELETKELYSWIHSESWMPGPNDLKAYLASYPECFWTGIHPSTGEPIGFISGVKYGDDFGFVGLYIVRPDCRGKGFGPRLWAKAMQTLEGVKCLGLDAVEAQVHNYQKWGFEVAHKNHRFRLSDPKPLASQDINLPEGSRVRTFSPSDLPALKRLDACMCPAAAGREILLKNFLGMEEAWSVVLETCGEITGVAMARRIEGAIRLGPVYAPDLSAVQGMLKELLGFEGLRSLGSGLVFDIPAGNEAGMRWAEGLGMQQIGFTCRMYRGSLPQGVDLSRVFSLASLELG